MSKERQLSETMQELKALRNEKESCITGIRIGMNSEDWIHVAKSANRIVEIEKLSIVKNANAKQLVIEVNEQREREVLEAIS
jgi:hypothetical protein